MVLTLEQKIARKSGIGGSDVAAIFGVPNPGRKTPIDIFFSKKEEEEPEAEEIKEDQLWGNLIEDSIRRGYTLKTGREVIVPPMFRHPKYTWMIANVDALDPKTGVVAEFKNVDISKMHLWGAQDTDEVAEYYLYQVAHYRIVSEAPKIDVVALFGGNRSRDYVYEKNERLEKLIIEKEHDFWHNYVLADVMPPFQTYEDVVNVYPKSDPALTKTATLELEEATNRFREVNKIVKNLEDEKEHLKKLIAESMQNHERLIDGLGRELLSWKSQSTNRFDSTEFKKQHPELYKQFIKTGDSRVFRLKGER